MELNAYDINLRRRQSPTVRKGKLLPSEVGVCNGSIGMSSTYMLMYMQHYYTCLVEMLYDLHKHFFFIFMATFSKG